MTSKDFFKTRYDLIVPFGQWCGVALWTRRLGLRGCSLPFDWMRGDDVSLCRYTDIVCDDFKGFMLRENLVLLHSVEKGSEGFNTYLDRGSGLESHHDIKPEPPIDEAYPAVRAKFDRRIARFYSAIKASQRTLFVHFVRTGDLSEAEVVASVNRLREKFAGSTIDFLVLQRDEALQEIEEKSIMPGVFVLRGRFYTKDTDSRYGDLELCKRVFNSICLRGRWKNLLRRRWSRLLWRLKCSCHISHEKRRAARIACRKSFW